jgi:hypothetical protein
MGIVAIWCSGGGTVKKASRNQTQRYTKAEEECAGQYHKMKAI